MELIKRIRHQLHDRMIERKLNDRIQRHSIAFEDAVSIGVLFNGTGLAERDQVKKFIKHLEKQGKTVATLCFIDTKEELPNFSWPYFTKKDLNWLGKNNSEAVQKFIDNSFDVLISCGDEQVLNDVSAQSKSKLRIGPIIEKEYCYDLMIAQTKQNSTFDYLKEVERFLNKLKTNAG